MVKDEQVRILMKLVNEQKSLATAAANAGEPMKIFTAEPDKGHAHAIKYS